MGRRAGTAHYVTSGIFSAFLSARYLGAGRKSCWGQIISMVIFMILGIRLMVKKSETNMWKNIWNIILENPEICPYGMYQWNLDVTGIAFGFLETNVLMILIMYCCMPIVFSSP